jgi:endonuclease VIII
MPEGDTIFRAAETLRKALLGKTITRFETTVDAVAAVNAATPVAGRTVSAVTPQGKHLLISFSLPEADDPSSSSSKRPAGPDSSRTHSVGAPLHPSSFSDDLVLHTHLRMTGSWHLYRPGEAWQKPARQAKVMLYTEDFVAPCFNAPVVALMTARQAARAPELTTLGPDAMDADFDPDEAHRRMRRRPEVEIGVALLNQRLMAGVGNVYKSEVLFLKRVSPFLKIEALSDEMLAELIAEAHRLMRLNQDRGSRRTVFGMNNRERLWVYGRSGEPCRVCGTPIRMRRQGMDARSTYFCPNCQEVER